MKRLTDIDRYWEGEEFWCECMESDAEDIDKIYNRLAAIEDILGDEYDLDRLRELAQADKEGRCVVLPCKVGGSLWVHDKDGKPREMELCPPDIQCYCKEEDIVLCEVLCRPKQLGVCEYRLRDDGTDIGKTVFLTRADAEAALRREQDG